jgi:hypothetical protein
MNSLEHIVERQHPKRFLAIAQELFKEMREHEIRFAYEGEITHQITLAFSALAEANLSKDEEVISVQRRVNHVIIECLQNITKHADDLKTDNYTRPSTGVFLVSKSKSEYSITTGNAIENHKLESLRAIIDKVNSANKDELDEMYMKQLSDGELSDVGGAGLGFIDIVMKTGRKLEYHFLKIDEDTSFFVLTSFVSRS